MPPCFIWRIKMTPPNPKTDLERIREAIHETNVHCAYKDALELALPWLWAHAGNSEAKQALHQIANLLDPEVPE
jgi:hypothetical protein